MFQIFRLEILFLKNLSGHIIDSLRFSAVGCGQCSLLHCLCVQPGGGEHGPAAGGVPAAELQPGRAQARPTSPPALAGGDGVGGTRLARPTR